MDNVQEIVKEYRQKTIVGKRVDLVPVTKEKMDIVLRLRSQENTKRAMNQFEGLSLDEQYAWFDSYETRLDDLYWFYADKDGNIEGTIRLSHIEKDSAWLDSGTGDERIKDVYFDFVAAEYMVLQFAKEILGVKKLIGHILHDNKPLLLLSKRQGFVQVDKEFIRGKEYFIQELNF